VVVTGCKHEQQSVQVQSMLFGDMVFTMQDGVVRGVGDDDSGRSRRGADPDIDYDYDDTLDNPDFDQLFADLSGAEADDLPPPPAKLALNLNVYLDKNWKSEFGNTGGVTFAKRILKHAADLLDHKSLGTKLSLSYEDDRIFNSNKHLKINKRNYEKELPRQLTGPETLDGGSVANLYLTFDDRPRLLGLARVNGMCSTVLGKPRAIVVFKNSEIRTAMTVAHELGHLIGIEHDFILAKRNQKCGRGKLSGEFVMNYGSARQRWSQCSNTDFKVYYNRVVTELTSFCLKGAPVGCSCNGKTDLLGNGNCRAGARPWCYVNRDANCGDQENYNGKFVSFLACSTSSGSSSGSKSLPSPPRTTRRPSPPRTTRRPSPPRTTRQPSSSLSSGQCKYTCIDDKGNCHTTYVGPPRPGNKRGTCFAQVRGATQLCSRIPRECKKCSEVLSC